MRLVRLALLAMLLLAQQSAASRSPIVTEQRIPGATLRITVRQPVDEEKAAEIVEWLRAASSSVALAYGRFPNPSPHVVVVPSSRGAWGSNSPVPFGRVTRYGEEKIELYINADRPIEDFYADWTATHEFSHLMLPYLQSEQRWVSEGFAQFYQNILLARAGRYTERYAWQKLFDGLERGRQSVPNLSPNDAAARDERNSRMKIYWSGAALALLADVELRHRSDGEQTLDSVLGKFHECCLPSQRTWTGVELFTRFDSFLDTPLFMNLYRQHADTAGFPDVWPLLQDLGVIRENNEVQLSDSAEWAHIRRSMTGRDAGVPEYDSPPRDR